MNGKIKPAQQESAIPDITIIDLENEPITALDNPDWENPDNQDYPDKKRGTNPNPVQRFFSHINLHIVLAALSVLVIAVIAYKVVNWGEYVDLDEIFKDGAGEYSDTFDNIIRLVDKNGAIMESGNNDGKTTVVVFGNGPFADDRNSKDGLANMIADMADATVYNCSVTGSFLAALPYTTSYETEAPINAFNFYWMCRLAVGNDVDQSYQTALQTLGSAAPPEAQEVYDTVKSIDFSTVDTIAVMYDASDYIAQLPIYNVENNTDILQFTGNLEAGIQLLQAAYPHIRIIVLSPTFAYSGRIDENTGKYIIDDVMREGYSVLATYVILQCQSCVRNRVSFVDNMYGTVTAENAEDCLTDYLHLNANGRKKVADRFIYALRYYDE